MTDQFRLDPTQSCDSGRRCERESSVSLDRTWEVLRHLPTSDQPLLALSRIFTNPSWLCLARLPTPPGFVSHIYQPLLALSRIFTNPSWHYLAYLPTPPGFVSHIYQPLLALSRIFTNHSWLCLARLPTPPGIISHIYQPLLALSRMLTNRQPIPSTTQPTMAVNIYTHVLTD